MLTVDNKVHQVSEAAAVIGTWGTTSRRRTSVLRTASSGETEGAWGHVQRLGNPLINELIIGTGSKDRFSMDAPSNDAQFSNFFLNPLLAQIFASIGIPVPPAPRTDLLPLVQYMAPICPGCTVAQAGPVADLLRLNTAITPTPFGTQKRLGFLAGDMTGFPNGRRPVDDVIDSACGWRNPGGPEEVWDADRRRSDGLVNGRRIVWELHHQVHTATLGLEPGQVLGRRP